MSVFWTHRSYERAIYNRLTGVGIAQENAESGHDISHERKRQRKYLFEEIIGSSEHKEEPFRTV